MFFFYLEFFFLNLIPRTWVSMAKEQEHLLLYARYVNRKIDIKLDSSLKRSILYLCVSIYSLFNHKSKVIKLFSYFRHVNHHLSDNQIFIAWMGNQFVQNVLVRNKNPSYVRYITFDSTRKGRKTLDLFMALINIGFKFISFGI